MAACFKSECNSTLNLFQIIIKDLIYISDYDGQIYNFYDDFYFTCPKFASVCPDLICPANCSGKGKCIWNTKIPYCECFDTNDTSDGCYGSNYDKPSSSLMNDENINIVSEEQPSLSPTNSSSMEYF